MKTIATTYVRAVGAFREYANIIKLNAGSLTHDLIKKSNKAIRNIKAELLDVESASKAKAEAFAEFVEANKENEVLIRAERNKTDAELIASSTGPFNVEMGDENAEALAEILKLVDYSKLQANTTNDLLAIDEFNDDLTASLVA